MRFVDTSFLVALRMRDDRNHVEAERIWRADRGALLTSNHVVGETWTFARRRLGHAVAVELLDRVERSARLLVESVGSDIEAEAWAWLRRHDERSYSFVDATSFAMMRAYRLREALAFDGDYAAAGFTEVRA
jgi:uncharacterized protein